MTSTDCPVDLKEVTVVLPTKNEEKAIGPVIDEILSVGVPKENIIVVDGYSTDRTREIAESKGVKVILQEGTGKAKAIATAVKYIKTRWTLIMDCDYTYPAKYIPELLRKAVLENLDEVIGARLKGRENIPAIFKLGNWALTKTFNLIFGTSLRDVLSGMYIVRTDVLKEINFEMKGFSVEAEIAAHVASTSGRIGEIPIEYRPRIGEKKLKVYHGFKIFVDIIRLAWRYNPTFLIFAIGSLLLIPGVVLAAYVAVMYIFYGIKYWAKGLLSAILCTTGLNSLLLAIFAIYLKRAECRILQNIRKLVEKFCT